MKQVFILHKREKDENGNSNTQLIGAYEKLKNLLPNIDIDANYPIDNVRIGLDVCGSYFIMERNGRVAYDIYLCSVLDSE